MNRNDLWAKEEARQMTVGELLDLLDGYPRHYKITFGSTLDGSPLVFNRVKQRGESLIQIELTELPD